MKKINKIVSYVLLGTILVYFISLLIVRKGGISNDISEIYQSAINNIKNYKQKDSGTVSLIIGALCVFMTAFATMTVIQIRRRKTPLLPILGAVVVVTAVMIMIVSKYLSTNNSRIFDTGTSKQQTLLTISYIFDVLIVLEVLALITVNVPLAFDSAEFKPNSKKSDKMKLVDIIIAASLGVIFILYVGIVFGNPITGLGKSVGGLFKYFFSFGETWSYPKNMIVPFGYLVLVGLIFLTVNLIKNKKTVIFPIVFLFSVLVLFTTTHYHANIHAKFTAFLAAGNIFKSFIVVFLILYLLFVFAYFLYSVNDCIVLLCEPKRLKLYNHREKYVYSERRKFGQSVVKEWESMKKGVVSLDEIVEDRVLEEDVVVDEEVLKQQLIAEEQLMEELKEDEEIPEEEEDDDDTGKTVIESVSQPAEEIVLEQETVQTSSFEDLPISTSKNIREKILELEPEKQERYNIVRNQLQSYKKVKQRFSRTVDSYRYAGELVAKISVLGKTVRLHLALDPDSYEVSKYHQLDLSSKNKYIFVPFTLKLKSKRSVKYAIELIDELMAGFDIPKNPNYKEEDYISIIKELDIE